MERRELLKGSGLAAATFAGVLGASGRAEAGAAGETNAYGSPPGMGLTIPPYYLPTPSVKNRTNYFPQSEPLGPDEMRVTFMGSQPWPPRLTQAGTCMMVETGNGKRLFFDFGSGCLRNIIASQVPVPEINDIFLTHLHIDHYADIPYLWQFAPFNGRWKPLRVIGPSGRTPELGTRAMCEAMTRMGAWTGQLFNGMPMEDGYQVDVTEFDFRDDGGVCYDKDGIRVIHWRRSHGADGAVGYRLDWNGLGFVWTGDGRPDMLTAKYARGADLFVTEMAVDVVGLWAMKQGVPPALGAFTIDNYHTPHYAVGYLASLVKPRLAMVTHFSLDRELVEEMTAGVRLHYNGLFAFGVDKTVVNMTRDRLWIRESVLPEAANTASPTREWMIANNFGGSVPKQLTLRNPFLPVQEQYIRDQEIDPALFTPKDQMRPWNRPPAEQVVDTLDYIGAAPAAK